MEKHPKLPTLYTRSGISTITSAPEFEQRGASSSADDSHNVEDPWPQPYKYNFPRPSISKRLHLKGYLHSPSDFIFLVRVAISWMWVLWRLHFIELPFHILTLFCFSTKQHPVNWPWWSSVLFAVVRAGAVKCQTMGQIRLTGLIISVFMPFQLLFFSRNYSVSKEVKIRVDLDALLRPERATLKELRDDLRKKGHSDDPFPSTEYLKSMHPQGPDAPLANLPEEVGEIDTDGTYTLQGEWIKALEDPDDHRPRSKTVILYFHGGAYVFCSTASHRHMLAKFAQDIGPGARVFSVGYRLAPEHPFPAAIHDAFAAYLYLTEPNHEALSLDEDSEAHELAVDPRDIVIAGDSAGGNLAAAFMQYMVKYVQPSTSPQFELPHATILLSPWIDLTSSLPAAKKFDWYCYTPGPIGSSPFDKKQYFENEKQNFASLYLCGDAKFAPNTRNALGDDRRWEWYEHLAQHPLVSLAATRQGNLSGMTNVLIQTATHDRLLDDGRLVAHHYGLDNEKQLTRIEVYKDMVHVHQYMFFLFESGRVASRNIARFIERSYHHREDMEHQLAIAEGRTASAEPQRTYAAVLRKTPVRDQTKGKAPQYDDAGDEYEPAYLSPSMVTDKAEDGVEWVLVEQNGRETAGDEGVPLTALDQEYAWWG